MNLSTTLCPGWFEIANHIELGRRVCNTLRVRDEGRGWSLPKIYLLLLQEIYFMFTGWRYGLKEPDDNTENFLITFDAASPQSYKKWTSVIEDLLSGMMPSGQK